MGRKGPGDLAQIPAHLGGVGGLRSDAGRSVPAELVQPCVVDAEMVRQFVKHGGADLRS